jgi:hypothetical protein
MKSIAAKENNGPAISHKEDNATLTAYFKEILPNYDEERVYASDIKKILNWYNTLQAKGLVIEEAPATKEVVEAVIAETEVPVVKSKKAKKVTE